MKIGRENQPANQPQKTLPGLRGCALDFFVIEFGDADPDNCVPGFFVVQHGIAPPSSRIPSIGRIQETSLFVLKIDRENQPANQPEKTVPGLRGRALDFLVIEFGDADADNCVPGFFVVQHGIALTAFPQSGP